MNDQKRQHRKHKQILDAGHNIENTHHSKKDQKHLYRNHKQLSDAGHNKENTHNSVLEDAEMCHTLKDGLSCPKMSKNDTSVINSSLSDHLTLYERHVLEQERHKNQIKNASFSERSLCTNKKDNFGIGADVTICEPSFPYQLTLHELFEAQVYGWKKNKDSTTVNQKHFANSDNKESDIDCNEYLTLYELYQMQRFECNSQRKNITRQEFIPNPANKQFYAQCRKNRMDQVPEWIKCKWKKQSIQRQCEGSKTARFTEEATMEEIDKQNNLKHKSFHPSANHVQKSISEAENLSIHMQQSSDEQQPASVNSAYKVLEKSPENRATENGGSDINSHFIMTSTVKLLKRHEDFLERESVASSSSDDISLRRLLEIVRLSEKNVQQKDKDKSEDENSERLAGQDAETVSLKEKSFCENMDQEQLTVQQWNEWSVKLLTDGQLCITGICNGVSSVSEDVSQWKRIDSHTLKNPKKNMVYKLVGIPDHYIGTDFPAVIQKKFQNGFPEDWLEAVKQWHDMRLNGNSAKQSDLWPESNDSDVSNACASSTQHHSSWISASKLRNQEMLKYAKVVVKKLDLSPLRDSSLRTMEKSSRATQDIQQQPKLSNERNRTREISFPQKDQAPQLKYTVTLRKVPDVQSSFDETDTSFF